MPLEPPVKYRVEIAAGCSPAACTVALPICTSLASRSASSAISASRRAVVKSPGSMCARSMVVQAAVESSIFAASDTS